MVKGYRKRLATSKFGGKTVLYDGARVEEGGSINLADSILNYDTVLFYSAFSTGGSSYGMSTGLVEPTLLLDVAVASMVVGGRSESTSWASTRIVTGQSTALVLKVQAASAGWTNAGIYRVVGINYSS